MNARRWCVSSLCQHTRVCVRLALLVGFLCILVWLPINADTVSPQHSQISQSAAALPELKRSPPVPPKTEPLLSTTPISGVHEYTPHTSSTLVSEGCPATSDVRGNLGPASVITSRVAADWLRDRWQSASDMSGTPIPGAHWLQIDLQQRVEQIHHVVIDFETAFATDYSIQCHSGSSGWTGLETSAPSVDKVTRQGIKHVIHKLLVPGTHEPCELIRLMIEKPATNWGTSVWEFQIFADGWPRLVCSAAFGALQLEKIDYEVFGDYVLLPE